MVRQVSASSVWKASITLKGGRQSELTDPLIDGGVSQYQRGMMSTGNSTSVCRPWMRPWVTPKFRAISICSTCPFHRWRSKDLRPVQLGN